MDDGVEELLEIDPFGEAVGCDKDTLDRLFLVRRRHVGDTITTLVRRENARHGFDGELRKDFAQTVAHMLGRRQITAEDNGVGPFLDERRQRLDQRGQLRVGLADQFLGVPHQREKRRIDVECCARFEIDRVLVISVVVIDLRFEAIAFARHAVPQRAQSSGRGRADATHQGQRAPESEALLPFTLMPGEA